MKRTIGWDVEIDAELCPYCPVGAKRIFSGMCYMCEGHFKQMEHAVMTSASQWAHENKIKDE